MNRDDLSEKLLDIKREKGWTWKYICEQIGGMSPIMVTGAVLGQQKMTKPQVRALRDSLYMTDDIPDSALEGDPPYVRPAEGSDAMEYLRARGRVLDGPLPVRVVRPTPAADRLRVAASGLMRTHAWRAMSPDSTRRPAARQPRDMASIQDRARRKALSDRARRCLCDRESAVRWRNVWRTRVVRRSSLGRQGRRFKESPYK